MTYKIMKVILWLFTISILIALLIGCNRKTTTSTHVTEIEKKEVKEKVFIMDTVLAPGDSIVFLDIDTTTNQEVRVVYKHNFDGGSSIAVDCPDVETKTITVSEVTDLSDETKRKIEDRFRREYEKKEGKLLKEIEKDQKRKYKEWYKEGVSDGKSKGRWQIIIMIAVAAGLVLFIKKKLPLNFPF